MQNDFAAFILGARPHLISIQAALNYLRELSPNIQFIFFRKEDALGVDAIIGSEKWCVLLSQSHLNPRLG